jgi:hypothetical protein
LSKLLELDYTIVYKKNIENKVVDALSRVEGQFCHVLLLQGSLLAVFEIIPQQVQDLTQSYPEDSWIASLLSSLNSNPPAKPQLYPCIMGC